MTIRKTDIRGIRLTSVRMGRFRRRSTMVLPTLGSDIMLNSFTELCLHLAHFTVISVSQDIDFLCGVSLCDKLVSKGK